VANVSEDKVALTIGRLTLRLLVMEQEVEELRGMYDRQASAFDDLQNLVDSHEREAMKPVEVES